MLLFDCSRLSTLAVVAALITGAAGLAVAADERIVLKIDGAFGTRFAATCSLKSEGGRESIMIDRKAPFEATFEGSGLSCEITAASAIEVELIKGGSRSFGSTSRGSVNVNVGS